MSNQHIWITVIKGYWEKLHRCERCWQSQRTPDKIGLTSTAPNNGFVPMDRRYPHADWCEHRGEF